MELAPDFALPDHEGNLWRLSDQRGRPVVLIFHRHLAWLACQQHAVAVRDRLGDLGGAVVALITFTRQRNLRGYRSRFGLPFAVLTDETRTTYRAYGLGRGRWWRVWGPATVRAYARLIRGGARAERPKEDTLQLGGDFVIGRDGRLLYTYRSRGPDDRPPVDDLVAAAAGHEAPT